MEKSIVKVYCDVSSCVHNVNGKKCNRGSINIASSGEGENEHFCKTYEHCCGFGKSE